jgi:hypothetical protein
MIVHFTKATGSLYFDTKLFQPYGSVHNMHLSSLKQHLIEAPSIINENVRNVLFHKKITTSTHGAQ